MKIFFSVFLSCSLFCVKAQEKLIKYYDSEWAASTKEKATYYAEFVKEDTAYKCQSYWIGSGIVRARSTFADTTFTKAIGTQLRYYKNGNVEDSTIYDDRGQIANTYHYHENKQLAIHYIPANKSDAITEAYDESGKMIKGYVYLKDAEFKGSDKAWHAYIQKNVTKDFRHDMAAKALRITDDKEITVFVQISFVIDENGFVADPKVLKSSEISFVDKDALRVIGSSPKWKNGIHLNKPAKMYRIQPFTYILTPEKDKKRKS